MSPNEFVGEFITKLRLQAADLRAYGALGPAQTCERNAQDLDDAFRRWWLVQLSVNDAAAESGYSPERLREMVRDRALPYQKGNGTKGHITIARCDLPRRPKPKPAKDIGRLVDRLLRGAPSVGN